MRGSGWFGALTRGFSFAKAFEFSKTLGGFGADTDFDFVNQFAKSEKLVQSAATFGRPFDAQTEGRINEFYRTACFVDLLSAGTARAHIRRVDLIHVDSESHDSLPKGEFFCLRYRGLVGESHECYDSA